MSLSLLYCVLLDGQRNQAPGRRKNRRGQGDRYLSRGSARFEIEFDIEIQGEAASQACTIKVKIKIKVERAKVSSNPECIVLSCVELTFASMAACLFLGNDGGKI